MSGTRAGGKRFARKMKDKYGEDYFKQIGSRGGKKSVGGGFTGDSARAIAVGKTGGWPAHLVKQAKKDKMSAARREQALRWMAEGKRKIDPVTKLLVPVKNAPQASVGGIDNRGDSR